MEDKDKPFSTEYAKSNRGACKTCGSMIPKDTMKLAKMVASPHFDGKVAVWSHFACFFRKHKVKTTGDIKGYGTLRYEDQTKIDSKVSAGGVIAAGKGASNICVDVEVEYAKSGRATCRGCYEQISKDAVRVGCWVDAEGEELKWAVSGKKQAWHHPKCFIERREELEIDPGVTADMLKGFKSLEEEDQKELIGLLGKGGAKKMKNKNKASKVKENVNPLHEKLMAQGKYLDEIRFGLKELPNKLLREMLVANMYPTHGADVKLAARCLDGLAFGRFSQPCPVCKNGTYFSLGENSYKCQGDVSDFTRCTNLIAAPIRDVWIIPERVKEESSYFNRFKGKIGTRLFKEAAPSSVEQVSIKMPLDGYVFFNSCDDAIDVKGDVKVEVDAPLGHSVKAVLQKTGGCLVYRKLTAKCNAVLCRQADIDKNSKPIKRAISLDLPLVDIDKLTQSVASSDFKQLEDYLFSGYEGEDYVKSQRNLTETRAANKRAKSMSSFSGGSMPKRAKVTVQNGAEVFSESGLAGSKSVTVYKDLAGLVWSATLGHVDVSRGKNSYYKIQVLKFSEHRYKMFRAWGRIGTTQGSTTFDDFNSPVGAQVLFQEKFLEKSGNVFGEPFSKKAGLMMRLDVDYGDEVEESSVEPGSKTALDKPVQDLMKLIFDIGRMRDALLEFEIDLTKMPLGKLSKNQIKDAFAVLSRLQQCLEDDSKDLTMRQVMILDATNTFYTLIPHDFGMDNAPKLDSIDQINTKSQMLENLLELEIAYSMTRVTGDKDQDPIDVHYNKLSTDISVMRRETQEFMLLEEYVKSTHAKTHTLYTLDIENIFQVKRHGEQEMYHPFSSLHNRQLLWHGSRVSNFAGILSQGLRIAPPEAPVTGYMFGKGVYFADMVSKSANYCNTSSANNTGLLLLCEVALGDMYELTASKFVERLPSGKHSTKGIGRTVPSAHQTTANGTLVPLGPGVDNTDKETSLLYNEYIVYDTKQINVKYLLQLKFNYAKRKR